MLKHLLLVLICAFFMLGCATTDNPTYVTTVGQGQTIDDAKNHAFKLAIEDTLGAIVTSDLEIDYNDVVLNTVTTHSSGYVTDYNIVEIDQINDTYFATVEILVAETRLRDFLLSDPNAIVDSNVNQAQVETFLTERQSGDMFLRDLFRYYPKHAFQIKMLPHNLKTNPQRQIIIEVPYELRWDYDFLEALNKTLSYVSDAKLSRFSRMPYGSVKIEAKDPKDWLIGDTSVHYFNDSNRIDAIKQLISNENELRLHMYVNTINGLPIINKCVYPKFLTYSGRVFYNLGSEGELIIYGNEVEKNSLHIEILNHKIISSITEISINLVSEKDCQ